MTHKQNIIKDLVEDREVFISITPNSTLIEIYDIERGRSMDILISSKDLKILVGKE